MTFSILFRAAYALDKQMMMMVMVIWRCFCHFTNTPTAQDIAHTVHCRSSSSLVADQWCTCAHSSHTHTHTHTHRDRPKVVEQVAPPPPPRPLCATCAREDVLTSKIAAEGHTVSPKQKYTRTNQPDRGERERVRVCSPLFSSGSACQ